MKVEDLRIQYPEDIHVMEVVITVPKTTATLKELEKIRPDINNKRPVEVTFKKQKKTRSLDANAYAWILMQKIAEVIGNTKEFVYRETIKSVGPFEILPIKDDTVERWISIWNSKGIGWYSEIYPGTLLEGYTRTINYYGSSVYNTKEMTVLLNEIIFQAQELDIDTITPGEQDRLLSTWKGA